MLSRVAESLYWTSRYLERAEHTARVMEVHLNLMLERDSAAEDRRWPRVLSSLGHVGLTADDPFTAAQRHALDQIMSCIGCARENGRQVREQISSEMWEELNRLFHAVKNFDEDDVWVRQPADFVTTVNQGCYLFQGVTDSTMNHGEGWRFLQVGRFIERAAATARLLDAHFRGVDVSDHIEWAGLLRCCTAFEAYCKVYTADLQPDRVAEFLLLNQEFPHSVRFAVERVQESLETVSLASGSNRAANIVKLAGRLSSNLVYTPLEEIMRNPCEFLSGVQRSCEQIHSSIYNVYIHYPIEAALAVR